MGFSRTIITEKDLTDLLSRELEEVFDRVSLSGEISAADRDVLRAALFDSDTTEEELLLIDRLYWRVRRGKLRIVE